MRKVWDNLGRTAGEIPFLGHDALVRRMKISGAEAVQQCMAEAKPILFVSAHYGNWELATMAANHLGIPLTLIYRPANNPAVDACIQQLRGQMNRLLPEGTANQHLPKGNRGAAGLLRALSQGRSIGMLIDQKMNSGVELPFLGHPAMTASAVAELALRTGAKIIPFRCIRRQGLHFDCEFLAPMDAASLAQNQPNPALAIMEKLHGILEAWIEEYPEQWFWVHRRWKD
jgi:KDO2-lipid IV(A) lauroyltransferase